MIPVRVLRVTPLSLKKQDKIGKNWEKKIARSSLYQSSLVPRSHPSEGWDLGTRLTRVQLHSLYPGSLIIVRAIIREPGSGYEAT